MIRTCLSLTLLAVLAFPVLPARAADDKADKPWVVYEGKEGPGKGKHIVFVTGDDEYRSEESMPQMAKILAVRHGFKCTVLFAIDPRTGTITPNYQKNIPGLAALQNADLMVLFTRFRDLPDEQMKYILDYVAKGKPIVAVRTATHAFNLRSSDTYKKYTWNNPDKNYRGGFGRQILGETWVKHYGNHGRQSTRGLVAEGMEDHPILRGVDDVWGPTDVYGITTLHGDAKPVLMGQVLEGMKPTDKPAEGKKLVPVAWIKTYTGEGGKTGRVFTTTMGASQDFLSEGLRRLFVNACYWALGMEKQIPAKADVSLVGAYKPTPFGFGKHKKGVKPSDLELK
jgi:hypothetical protein